MGFFNKMKEPVFLKEGGDLSRQLQALKELEPSLDETGRKILRQDMKYIEYGIQGENAIAYELKNSHMPMYILHDIYLEDGELSAQIDYLVITRKLCFVIECKNLYGDIEISGSGDFIRTIDIGGRRKREGIYSPVTQNQRHLELIKKIKLDTQSNFLAKMMADRYFCNYNRAIVVLANPKTVLNAKYAKKEIKEQVIRADQLITYIKEQCRQSKEAEDSDEAMLNRAEWFLKMDRPVAKDYTSKYQSYIRQPSQPPETKTENGSNEDLILFKELKVYRLMKSREENVKPYFLYNDRQLNELIDKMPKTVEELLKVSGFGPVKVQKYGGDLLNILDKYR